MYEQLIMLLMDISISTMNNTLSNRNTNTLLNLLHTFVPYKYKVSVGAQLENFDHTFISVSAVFSHNPSASELLVHLID